MTTKLDSPWETVGDPKSNKVMLEWDGAKRISLHMDLPDEYTAKVFFDDVSERAKDGELIYFRFNDK